MTGEGRRFVLLSVVGWLLLTAGCAGGDGVRAAPDRDKVPSPSAQDARALWTTYAEAPDRHPNIPNASYAGYHASEQPLPMPPVVANVRELGARADGQSDDGPAFRAALRRAAEAGGGAVLVPAGTYRIGGLLHLATSGAVLRGEGPGRTILEFTGSLTEAVSPLPWEGRSQWSWAGGLIWIGPADTFDPQGRVQDGLNPRAQSWEYWRPVRRLARVTSPLGVGASTLTVDTPAGLQPGAWVLLTWKNPSDASLLKHVFGFAKTALYDWPRATWILPPSYPRFQWPVRVAAVAGPDVTLAQPLRLEVRPEWDVGFEELGPSIAEAGVEHLSLRLHAPASRRHLASLGWNGVFVNRAHDCWVADVVIEGSENGVLLSAAKNVTVAGVTVGGDHERHHPFACRASSHDNLFEDFAITGTGRVRHGINTEWLSSGNVWHRGRMTRGTFDSHRALSFDSIRTDIDLTNDEGSQPGGADPAGPYLGKRIVHWNVRISGSDRADPGAYVNQPACLPMGALVGIQGAPLSTAAAPTLGPGRKGCVVASPDERPDPPDLFEAELRLRLGRR